MRLAVGQVGADADDEHGPALPADLLLALAWWQIGPAGIQLLGSYELDVLRQHRPDARMLRSDVELGAANGLVDRPDGAFEHGAGAVLGPDHLLPVPLVHVDRMEIVEHLVGPDGVHVGIEALADREAVPRQGHPLPLGQRLHDLDRCVAVVLHAEANRLLDAVEVVVHARAAADEQRSGDPLQIQRRGQAVARRSP